MKIDWKITWSVVVAFLIVAALGVVAQVVRSVREARRQIEGRP